MSKFYAIRKGYQTGIVTTWRQCQEVTKGFKGAEYKSFTNLEDANKFLEYEKEIIEEGQLDKLYIYVDGSYNEEENIAGWGFVSVMNNQELKRSFGGFKDHPFNRHRNVFGEVNSIIEAIDWAMNNRYSEVIIGYDYAGLEKWATGEYQAKNEMSQTYVRYIKWASDKINIKFLKIAGHTGHKYNEIADVLSKQGAKII